MIYQIAEVLEPAELAAVSEACQRVSFEDGRATAGAGAAGVKQNLQAASQDVQGVLRMVEDRVARHALVRAAALPKQLVRLTVARYEAGMNYGLHTDNALITNEVVNQQTFSLSLSVRGKASARWCSPVYIKCRERSPRTLRGKLNVC